MRGLEWIYAAKGMHDRLDKLVEFSIRRWESKCLHAQGSRNDRLRLILNDGVNHMKWLCILTVPGGQSTVHSDVIRNDNSSFVAP